MDPVRVVGNPISVQYSRGFASIRSLRSPEGGLSVVIAEKGCLRLRAGIVVASNMYLLRDSERKRKE